MSYGVTDAGFVIKRDSDIIAELVILFKSIYGDINTAGDSVFGQEIGIKAKLLADAWEMLEAIYNSYSPDMSYGTALDNVLALSLLTRVAAIKTEAVCTITGTPATVIPAGSQVSNGIGDKFETLIDYTISGGGTVSATFRALESGAVPAVAGTVTIIETTVSGWLSVTNPADGTIGRGPESDVEARLRRALSFQISGAGTIGSIQAAIINDIENVSSCSVFENETDATDVNGVPPHAIHVVVLGGIDQDIADKIWSKKAGGIATYGNTSATVVDSNGDSHTVYFSRPANKYVWVEVTINSYYTEETFPADGEQQIKDAVVAYGNALPMGKDLIIQRWQVPIYSIPGIGSVTVRHATTDSEGGTPSYGTSNIAIGPTSQAVMADARITVNL